MTGDKLTLADRVSPARTRISTGVRLGVDERLALERVVLWAAVTVDHARTLTGVDHHEDLTRHLEALIAAAEKAEADR